MDWLTPPRTKALGAAALLTAAAALWPTSQDPLPLLNGKLGPLAVGSALQSPTSHKRTGSRFPDDDVQKETRAVAEGEWRDALSAPAGLSWASGMEPARSQWRSSWGKIGPIPHLLEQWIRKPATTNQEPALPQADEPSVSKKNDSAKTQAAASAFAVHPRTRRKNFSFFPRLGRLIPRRRRVMIQDFGNPDQKIDSRPSRLKTVSPRARPQGSRDLSFMRRAATAKKTARRPPAKFRPLLLSALMGKNAIRPPQGDIAVPDLSILARRLPKNGPDGRPWNPPAAQPKDIESWRPLQRPLTDCRKSEGHWHQASGGWLYHEQKAWAATEEGRLGWLARQGGRWWAWTAAEEPTWLSHQGRWWWKSEGVWFLLHQAQAWAYRLFLNGRAEGLFHPGTGTSMVYSQDGRRVAVVTPGAGAVLFDAVTGQEIRRWSEEELKSRKKPSAPSALTFPR